MLKFSGYSYLIRGQPFRSWGFYGEVATKLPVRGENYYAEEATAGPPLDLGDGSSPKAATPIPNTKQSLRVEMTLEQACPPEY
jgi:hypothetical protein